LVLERAMIDLPFAAGTDDNHRSERT